MALDIVIFGGLGDLSLRKLLPSLYYLFRDGNLIEDSRILCVSRKTHSRDAFLDMVGGKLKEYLDADFDDEVWQKFSSILAYEVVDLTTSYDWHRLVSYLNISEGDIDRSIIYYLSVTPSLFAPVCRQIEVHDLNPSYSRVVVEKPLGENFETAQEVNKVLSESFSEKQIYRIDHYLGKPAVQNITHLRFGNPLMETIWNKDYIESIEITVAETVGVESRIEFLDRVGTLRDMVQNHLMQLLTLVAMEAPASMAGDDVRSEKCRVIKSLKVINEANSIFNTIRGQYSSGVVANNEVPAYQEELANSEHECAGKGETFVLIKANVENERWENVPFYLRTGKRMSGRFVEIRMKCKEVEHDIIINIQPDMTVSIEEALKNILGNEVVALQSEMNSILGADKALRVPEAYERLLHEVIKGNQTYFVRDDEIMASWKWIDGIRDAWAGTDQEIQNYQAGTMGPQLD